MLKTLKEKRRQKSVEVSFQLLAVSFLRTLSLSVTKIEVGSIRKSLLFRSSVQGFNNPKFPKRAQNIDLPEDLNFFFRNYRDKLLIKTANQFLFNCKAISI